MYKIIADSGCDIFELPGAPFATVPLTISTDKRTFVDDADIDTAEMIEYMLDYKGRSYTACPSASDWISVFDNSDGSVPDEIYIVTLTGTLSGTFNSANLAKEIYLEEHPDTRFCIIDSLSVGPEMRLILEKLAELKAEGLSFEETEKKIRAYCSSTRLFFAFKSLHNLAQNGRVNKLAAAAAGVLGISILGTATENGEIAPLHKARGESKVISTMFEMMLEAGYKGGKVNIINTENEALANLMAVTIKAAFPTADIKVYPTRGLCSFYCERGGFCVGMES